MKKTYKPTMYFFVLSITCALFISGCTKVNEYDDATYNRLLDLKKEMKEYFENCQANGVSGERGFSKLNSIKNSSANAYGFEKSRENNKETMEQLEIIDNSVTSVIDRYKSNLWENTECKPREDNKQLVGTGCLTTGYCKGKWLVLSSGLDIAISTEELKVRGK